MIPNELMQSDIVQWLVGIAAGAAVLVSTLKGQKAARDSRVGDGDKALFSLLRNFSELAGDVEVLSRAASNLERDVKEVSESLKVMMETNRRTLDKVDSIETSVAVLKDRG
jgi:hypothetical protein